MKTTLRDLLHAINILGDDRDVYVDGIDEIAVCPPIKLTAAGQNHFQEALNAKVEVEYKDDCHCNTYVSDDDENINEKAWELLTTLAGYCAKRDFNKWVENDKAELI